MANPTGADSDPNAEQRRRWQDIGQDWTANDVEMEERLGGWGRDAMGVLDPRPGERILDIGCGAGHTTVALAQRVAPGGHAVGMDISGSMLARATAVGRASGAAVRFVEADAQSYSFATEPAFDGAFSRFGVMFFTDPVAAFTNVRRGLRAGGRVTFTCWAGLADNPWAEEVRAVIARRAPIPPIDPDAPGPHQLAEPAKVRSVLGAAGFAAVVVDGRGGEMTLGATASSAEEMVAGMLATGLGRDTVRAHPELRKPLLGDLLDAFGSSWAPGGLHFPAAVLVVSATNPES